MIKRSRAGDGKWRTKSHSKRIYVRRVHIICMVVAAYMYTYNFDAKRSFAHEPLGLIVLRIYVYTYIYGDINI